MAFKELHSNITDTWSKIYTKVFNERKTAREKIKKHLKLEIRSVEHGICPIAEFTSPLLSCAAILAIRP